MRIGNTSFNVEAIKKMSFDEFSKMFKGQLVAPKKTLEQVYEEITGKKPEEKNIKKPFEPNRRKKIDEPDQTKGDEVKEENLNDSGE